MNSTSGVRSAQPQRRRPRRWAAIRPTCSLYESPSETLVAVGTSDSEVGRRQHQIGMERQPLANGGAVVGVFRSGQAYHTRRADQDPEQLCGMLQPGTVANQVGAILGRLGLRNRTQIGVWSVEPQPHSPGVDHPRWAVPSGRSPLHGVIRACAA